MSQKKKNEVPVLFRMVRPADQNFILSTYMRSYVCRKHRKDKASQCVLHDSMKEMLARRQAWVACDPLDDDVIYGYVIFGENRSVLFGYVSKVWRGNGFFKKLCAAI